MWPFTRKKEETGIKASTVTIEDGIAVIDVRGQTCPGYLLAINNEVDKLDKGLNIDLLITYPPCREDVEAWCKARNVEYMGISQNENMWIINIKK